MKKSKFVFVILSVVYLLMGILYPFGVLDIGGNLLLALSTAALLISLGDICEKIHIYRIEANQYNAALDITIEYLDSKISSGQINNPIISVRNFKANLENLQKKNYKFCHPSDYISNKCNWFLRTLSFVLFIVGIASFIVIPFISENISNSAATSVITILAFAAMALSLFFDEIIIDKQHSLNNLMQDKHLVLQSAFSDFLNYFQIHMFYMNDLIANQSEDGGNGEHKPDTSSK